MPSSVHKLHGVNIISYFKLPIRQLSEDDLESLHKVMPRNRLRHTRKSGRENSNKPLIVSSNPYISTLRKTFTKINE